MGSRERLNSVLGGADPANVWNKRTDPAYKVRGMGEVAKDKASDVGAVVMSDKNLARDVMPNVDDPVIQVEKVAKYVLNFTSDKGKDKARVISAAFGLTDSEEDAMYFIKALKDGLPGSTVTRELNTEWGKRFEAGIAVTGKNGHTESVRTAWQYDKGSSTPRLLTAFLEGKKK